MKKIIGILFALLALYMFFIAVTSVGPIDSAFSLGYFIGSHSPWVICAIVSFYLLKN